MLAGARPGGRILIADWGGDAAALDCAELLAEEGRDVTLAVGAVTPGETLHQYVRNGYIARLCRLGVRIEHYLGLEAAAAGVVRFRNVFAPDLRREIAADALLVSLGRVPEDGLADALRAHGGFAVEEAGDCRSPRSIEEAVLEGTLAARRTAPVPAEVARAWVSPRSTSSSSGRVSSAWPPRSSCCARARRGRWSWSRPRTAWPRTRAATTRAWCTRACTTRPAR